MSVPCKVLVTGAAGFVGQALCRQLLARGFSVVAAARQAADIHELSGMPFSQVEIGDMATFADWPSILTGVDAVVHLAARVHIQRDDIAQPLEAYRSANVVPTNALATAAARAGVRRLVFLSSIKVNGEQTGMQPFREKDLPNPQDAYAISKWEAEQALWEAVSGTGMEVVILRLPLVYGPGVKANFLRLLRWVDKGVPLPLASVQNNRRSMIYLGNLVDALIAGLEHPAAANKTYLISDGEDVSTVELIRRIAAACGRKPCLWPCPETVLRKLGVLSGKKPEVDRLVGSLQVDSSRFREDVGWVPPYSMAVGLRQTIAWYRGLPN